MTPQEGIKKLLSASSFDQEIAKELLSGNAQSALDLAKATFPEDNFDISQNELNGLSSIKAEKLLTFERVAKTIKLLD